MSQCNKLTIFQMNDSHGYLEPHPELFWSGEYAEYRTAGGYARIASLMREGCRDNHVLAFDCGDTLLGTYVAAKTGGRALIPILNCLDFNAMTAHWEFALGPKQFHSLARELNYPVLAINCYEKKTGNLAFPPFTMLEKNGLLIGVIGIASNIVDKVMPASFSEGLRFTLGREELLEYVRRLRQERADLIIVISHLGFPQDVKLAGETNGVDLWLSGHTHNRVRNPVFVNGTPLIQSGCHGSFLGRIDIEVEKGKVRLLKHQLLDVSEDVVPCREVEEMVNRQMQPHRNYLETVVGETKTPLNRNTMLESTMDNFLLQSLIDLTGSDVAFSNGWRFGAPVPAGSVTVNDLYNIIPMNPPVSTAVLTGKEILQMMEENLERTFSRDPYGQMGGYVKRFLGMNVYFKIENPPGNRVQEVFIQGKRVQPEARYSAVFVTTQGVPEHFGAGKEDLQVRAVEAMQHLLVKGSVHAELRGSAVAV